MGPYGFRKANHLAIIGFLLPFAAAALLGLLLMFGKEDFRSLRFSVFYLSVVPLALLVGIVLCLKSIPLIEERGDQDYAYSGLTLNILFIFVYIVSLICYF
jgi:hypothetical protein